MGSECKLANLEWGVASSPHFKNSERTVFEILPSAADSDADREVSSAADVALSAATVVLAVLPVAFALSVVIVAVIADYSPAAKLARGSPAIAATMQPRRGAAPESARMSVSLFSTLTLL